MASGVDRHSWQAIAPPENPRPAENKREGIAESEILNLIGRYDCHSEWSNAPHSKCGCTHFSP
jgi:hypothetical protein